MFMVVDARRVVRLAPSVRRWLPAALVLLVTSGAWAGNEATGQFPSINETLGCNYNCVDTFLAKCSQPVRFIESTLTDVACGAESLIGTLTAIAPATALGLAATQDVVNSCSDYASVTRPTTGEGSMQAIITVTATSTVGSVYNINAACFSAKAGVYRSSTSLVIKQNQ